ncbi:hypothetical protein SmB9_05770 [Sphingosinicella microcystinivorans]|uniref:Uncharacterized protein n=2 Tax=Sphingosinicella microcystinivorans TaxID=335406 RepID=A0AAD1D3Y7_SPHMI|nr:hypothetical protein SmB9_05770 [Sphingosinicella microcystinivorans]
MWLRQRHFARRSTYAVHRIVILSGVRDVYRGQAIEVEMKTIIVCACLLFIAAVGAIAIPPHAGAIASTPPAAADAAVHTR